MPTLFTSSIKDLIEQNALDIVDADTIQELSSFVPKGSSYEADKGCHDDMVMNCVMFGWFVSIDAFGNIDQIDLKKMLYTDREAAENDMLDFPMVTSQNDINDEYREMARQLQEWKDL